MTNFFPSELKICIERVSLDLKQFFKFVFEKRAKTNELPRQGVEPQIFEQVGYTILTNCFKSMLYFGIIDERMNNHSSCTQEFYS